MKLFGRNLSGEPGSLNFPQSWTGKAPVGGCLGALDKVSEPGVSLLGTSAEVEHLELIHRPLLIGRGSARPRRA